MSKVNVVILDDKKFREKWSEFCAHVWSAGARVPNESMVPPVLYDARTGETYIHKSQSGALA
jgi:hypothetical protein